jgi:hypothetical protein
MMMTRQKRLAFQADQVSSEPVPAPAAVGSREPILMHSIRAATFDEATWPTAKTVLARVLAMRSCLTRERWWN